MCLLADKNNWFVAEENVHAYKAVFVPKEGTPTKWRGIYQINKSFPFDKVLKEKGKKVEPIEKVLKEKGTKVEPTLIEKWRWEWGYLSKIGKGFFHSATKISTVETIIEEDGSLDTGIEKGKEYIGVICKVTIPKGSLCCRDYYQPENIASNKIIVHNPFAKEEEE